MLSLRNLMRKIFSQPAPLGETDKSEQIIEEVSKPVNFVKQHADVERIMRDAKYAIDVANSYVFQMPGQRDFLKDKDFVELGPGINFGTPLILLCWGARHATVSDRFLSQFNDEYHISVYKEIVTRLKADDPNIDTQVFEEVIERRSHETSRLSCDISPLEELSKKYIEAFDFTISNAVFEHLYHPLKAIESLYYATRIGGMGFHQVDFRDHRDFARPLEYLLQDEFSFHEMLEEHHCECGNRIRSDEMLAMFFHVGFKQAELFPNMFATPEYLEDFIPRLKASTFSPYSDIAPERLQVISGRYVIQR